MSSREYHNQLIAAYHTQFAIPEYLTENLELYKRLNWSASYFMQQWESNIATYAAGTIRRYNLQGMFDWQDQAGSRRESKYPTDSLFPETS